MGVAVTCHEAICKWLENQSLSSFSAHTDLGKDTDVLFSVGGDGTLLRSLELIRNTEIPVIGVNTGRLGFLATLQADDIQVALQAFVDRQYRVEKRTLLEVEIEGAAADLAAFPLALNEVGVSRKNTTAMITVHTKINGEPLNSYWADGFMFPRLLGQRAIRLAMADRLSTQIASPWCSRPLRLIISMHALWSSLKMTWLSSVLAVAKTHTYCLWTREFTPFRQVKRFAYKKQHFPYIWHA